jgi:hypothetical protein
VLLSARLLVPPLSKQVTILPVSELNARYYLANMHGVAALVSGVLFRVFTFSHLQNHRRRFASSTLTFRPSPAYFRKTWLHHCGLRLQLLVATIRKWPLICSPGAGHIDWTTKRSSSTNITYLLRLPYLVPPRLVVNRPFRHLAGRPQRRGYTSRTY